MGINLKYGCFVLLASVLGGCQETDRAGSGKPLEIIADIRGAAIAETRANLDEFGSYDSKGGFTDGDRIGFYSMRDENGNPDNGYVNLPADYSKSDGFFKNDNLIADYPNNFGYTFAYYPYDAGNTCDVFNIYRPDGTIEDVLVAGTSRLTAGRLYLSFVHAFSMLIIVPGNGFEEAAADPGNQVTLVLKYGLDASVEKDPAAGKMDLVLNRDDNAPKRFRADRRTDVSYEIGGEPVPVCYSVIIPNGAEVSHIEMKDNHGILQRVNPEVKSFKRSWRYPVRVNMVGTTPVVWPYEIQPWVSSESPVDLGGEYGINTPEDFLDWAVQYNLYTSGTLSDEERENVIGILRSYGEMVEGKWHFQLNMSIDCSGLFGTDKISSVISRFPDEFDGKNHTLYNLDASFIEVLEENGLVTDLNVEGISIISEKDLPVGAIAMEMSGGEISECDVRDIFIETEGPAGALVGNAVAGTIRGNTVNGQLYASESSADGLTGLRSVNVICENNRNSGLIF